MSHPSATDSANDPPLDTLSPPATDINQSPSPTPLSGDDESGSESTSTTVPNADRSSIGDVMRNNRDRGVGAGGGEGEASVDTAKLAELVAEELAKAAAYKEAKDKQMELSNSLVELYEHTVRKLHSLRTLERSLSVNAGQLLKALQTEESVIQSLSSCMKRIKTTRKTLLSHITNPRWEVRHHYHMTAMEHNYGHRQPHVMDVAELLPGHLRLYAYSRCGALMKRMLTWALSRAKNERNSANDQIKEVYRQLREARADLKALGKIIDNIKARSKHLGLHDGFSSTESISTPNKQAQIEAMMRQRNSRLGMRSGMGGGPPSLGGGSSRASESTGSSSLGSSSTSSATMMNIRMRYFKSLNLAPKSFIDNNSDSAKNLALDAKQRAETYNTDWKNIATVINNLEAQKKESSKAEQELQLIQNMRKRIGLESLPSPLKFTAPASSSSPPIHPHSDNNQPSSPLPSSPTIDPTHMHSPDIAPDSPRGDLMESISLLPSVHDAASPSSLTSSSHSTSIAGSTSSTASSHRKSIASPLLTDQERNDTAANPLDTLNKKPLDDDDDDDDDDLLDRLSRAQISVPEEHTDDSDTESYTTHRQKRSVASKR